MRIAFIICLVPCCLLPAQTTPPSGRAEQWSPQRVFTAWDSNGDGQLTAEETPNAGLFKMRDKNGDGKLSREELPGALFDRLDANKDGFVTEDELKSLWKAR